MRGSQTRFSSRGTVLGSGEAVGVAVDLDVEVDVDVDVVFLACLTHIHDHDLTVGEAGVLKFSVVGPIRSGGKSEKKETDG